MEPPADPGLSRLVNKRITLAANVANAAGALILMAFLLFLFPASPSGGAGFGDLILASAILGVIYLPATLYIGFRRGVKRSEPMLAWLRGERAADEAVRRVVLDHPMWAAKVSAFFWTLAAALFGLMGLIFASFTIASAIFDTLVLGGITTAAVLYLLVERILRPIVPLALASGPAPELVIPGIAARMTMAWTLATGVPLVGVVALAIADLAGADLDQNLLIVAVLFLTTLALGVGFLAILFAARGVADPIAAVRREQQRVERGDLDAAVPVDDGSEVGLLQVGFNRMVAGLRERELLRDAFGTYVDPGLTERVLAEGTDLTGEEVELTVMFLDVRGFTTLAEHTEAHEVVARLNELYELVVPIVLRHGGHANKFIGDGLLSVFGAPRRLPDHADCAIAAALDIAAHVNEHFAGALRVGIGLNTGRVVVGTIGGGGRLDFTVIGDAVNTAARVESATRETGDDVLATRATLDLLERDFGDWQERPPVALKGKAQPVALYAPVRAPAPAPAA